MSLRKILCPIDFSPGSDHALRIAASLATSSHCELVISHAWFVPQATYMMGAAMMSPGLVQAMVDDDERGLAVAVARAKALGAGKVTALLHTGPPGEVIVRMLNEDHSFDLVVLGTHGRTGLARVVLGSVAEAVVRHAPCSVLAAREGKEPATFRSILCPIDFSDSSALALERAAELVEPGGDGIMLLHAIDLPSAYSSDLSMPDAMAELDRQAARALEQWATKLRGRVQVPVRHRIVIGRPGREILEATEREAFDLVVMGSHGRTGLRRIFLGSVAEKTVRHAPCPVLVARTREA